MHKFRITINTMFGYIEGVIAIDEETSELISTCGPSREAVLVECIVDDFNIDNIELREIKDNN